MLFLLCLETGGIITHDKYSLIPIGRSSQFSTTKRISEKRGRMLKFIASALNRNDETPNIELAEKLVNTQDANGISQIVTGLNMDKATANDCIKVLYEIGERDPQLILPYASSFLDLLKSKNNRLVWGAMTALGQIASLCPDTIFARFDDVYAAYEKGSVITVDHSMSVLAALCRASQSNEQKILPLLIHHLANCRTKEIPQHFERIAICITNNNANQFRCVIQQRYGELSKSQQARVNKVLKSINN